MVEVKSEPVFFELGNICASLENLPLSYKQKKKSKLITARNSGLHSVLEKRWVLAVPIPRFHVDTVRGIYVFSNGDF